MKETAISMAMDKKYPESVAMVTSSGKGKRPNIIVLAWHMQTSFQPLMVAISVGKSRYSHRLIKEGGEFVLAFPGADLEDKVLFCGTHSGRDTDKFEKAGLTPVPAKTVKPPLIEECLANLECKVVGSLDSGDHTIFVGEVLKAYLSENNHRKRLYVNAGRKFTGL